MLKLLPLQPLTFRQFGHIVGVLTVKFGGADWTKTATAADAYIAYIKLVANKDNMHPHAISLNVLKILNRGLGPHKK